MPTGEGPCACTHHGVAGCTGVKARGRNKCRLCARSKECNNGPLGPECRCPICKGACGNDHMGSRARCSRCSNNNCPLQAQEEKKDDEEEDDEPEGLKDYKELLSVPFTGSADVFECERCGGEHQAGTKSWTCTGGHTFCPDAVARLVLAQKGRVKKCPTCDVHIL